jgi:cysteinyl-tRNA synthetase
LDTPGQQADGVISSFAWFDSTMDLKLYDTLTREKRVFTPLDPNNVRMYVCGPTVYDFAHIGNARPVIVFDVLFRLLRHLYGADHVTYVRNITDVDDKINARAAEDFPGLPLNDAIRKVTETTDRQFHDDVAALGCLPPTVEPRATEHIAEMKTLIERLIASGNAYVAEDNVLFSVPSDPNYGQLSKRPLDELIAGARVEVAPYKRDPRDFVLWKPSKPGEPAWPSPAGIKAPGRPGWHIECSAMSDKWLWTEAQAKLSEAGKACPHQFDIHGGGIDLVFPHHEDEIAQSRCAFHTPMMANYWMHNGFLQVEGEKMSKSLGNFLTIHELLNDWSGEVLRLQMLMTHYRQPIDWITRKSTEVENELWAWVTTLVGTGAETDGYLRAVRREPPRPSRAVLDALLDDLNTPEALAVVRANYKAARDGGDEEKNQFLMDCQFLGLLRHDKLLVHMQGVSGRNTRGLPIAYEEARELRISVANNLPELRREAEASLAAKGLGAQVDADGSVTLIPLTEATKSIEARIEKLIAERNAARKVKDFKESDRIRDELAKMGVVLKDTKDGTTWEIAR